MLVSNFVYLFFTPLTLASTLSPRQSPGATQILSSISAIDTAVHSLTSALTSYAGGINASLPVFAASLEIHRVNRAGFAANAGVAGPLSPADSDAVAQRVQDTVAVSIPEATKVLEAKKGLFDEAEISSLVLGTINLLKYDHETFSAGVGEKLSPGALPKALAGAGKVEAVLVEASLYYTV